MAWVYWTATANGTSSTTSTAWNNWTTTTTYIYDTSSSATWGRWNSGTGLYIASTTSTTWENWVFREDGSVIPGRVNGEQVRALTEEERERERGRLEQMARERGEEERKRQEAEEKALTLLKENLTEDQRAVFEETGVIPVVCRSGRKYHIRKGIAGNVHELDEKGATARRLCFHPPDCPIPDVMLAQKLLLETDEEMARKIANFS